MTAMMDVRSASVSLKPRSCKPIRSSSPVTLPQVVTTVKVTVCDSKTVQVDGKRWKKMEKVLAVSTSFNQELSCLGSFTTPQSMNLSTNALFIMWCPCTVHQYLKDAKEPSPLASIFLKRSLARSLPVGIPWAPNRRNRQVLESDAQNPRKGSKSDICQPLGGIWCQYGAIDFDY